MTKVVLTPLMRELLRELAGDGKASRHSLLVVMPNKARIGFAANTLTGLIKRGLVTEDGQTEGRWWVISAAGRAALAEATAPIPFSDPTTPIPVNELENADEPCGDVGTWVDPEPANNLPDVQPSKPSPFAQRSSNSPLRDQYLALKADYRNHLMFFRLGDFYELFDADAETAARELDLVLTNRPIGTVNGKPVRVPMCGVPYHSVDQFIDKLTAKGFDVVVVEQVSEPNGRGLVERRVSRVILGIEGKPAIEQKPDPRAWATPERRAEVRPLLNKLTPMVFEPTATEGVWLLEDAVTEKTMRRGLKPFDVEIVSLEPDELNGEPYCIVRFRLPNPTYQPFPSKRQTLVLPDLNTIYAQHVVIRASLPETTRLLLQVNGDEWAAFEMTATLLRRDAPFCVFTACVVNQKGERWDRLIVPAEQVNNVIRAANAQGVTVALASIVKDEAGSLPKRAVTEVFYADGSAEQIDIADDETTPDEVDAAPVSAPVTEPAPKLEITPERQAAIIKRHIAGGMRLGRVEAVEPFGNGGVYVVKFTHPVNQNRFALLALDGEYEVDEVGVYTVYLRLKSAPPVPDVQAQADAVIAALPEPEAPTVVLLSEDAETALIAALRVVYPDLDAACFGVTHFLANVIARMQTAQAVGQPF